MQGQLRQNKQRFVIQFNASVEVQWLWCGVSDDDEIHLFPS